MGVSAAGGASTAGAHAPHATGSEAPKPAPKTHKLSEDEIGQIKTSKDAHETLQAAINRGRGWFERGATHGKYLTQLNEKIKELTAQEKSSAIASAKEEHETAPQGETGAAGTGSNTNQSGNSKSGANFGHILLSGTISATLATGLLFLLMEHKQKKTLAAVSHLKQDNAKLTQALQAASDGSIGGYGADSSNQGLALAS